jgi:hypothetical protein
LQTHVEAFRQLSHKPSSLCDEAISCRLALKTELFEEKGCRERSSFVTHGRFRPVDTMQKVVLEIFHNFGGGNAHQR